MSTPGAKAGAQYLRGEMESAFPDAMVEHSLYVHLIPTMPNNQKDRHVLTVAVARGADVLVTANIKNFRIPRDSFNVEIQHPHTFLCHQLELGAWPTHAV